MVELKLASLVTTKIASYTIVAKGKKFVLPFSCKSLKAIIGEKVLVTLN